MSCKDESKRVPGELVRVEAFPHHSDAWKRELALKRQKAGVGFYSFTRLDPLRFQKISNHPGSLSRDPGSPVLLASPKFGWCPLFFRGELNARWGSQSDSIALCFGARAGVTLSATTKRSIDYVLLRDEGRVVILIFEDSLASTERV